MYALEVKDLTKVYTSKQSTKTALNKVNLTIPQGSFFGLLGPNGAGKSTLINIVAGLTNKTSGEVKVCGYDIETQTKLAKQNLGVVPQELLLDPFFPVDQALENTAGFYGIKKANRKTNEIIKALGLEDKAKSSARSLSGGMKRRLLVAKALVHSPKLLILDEPTAGVDVELRTQLWDYVKNLNKQGTTILLTTHYLEEAEELCDHIAIINHGEIIVNESKKNILRTIDSKKITIYLNKELKEIPKVLLQFNPILSNNSLEITYSTKTTSIPDILTAIENSGFTIKDISTSEPDLEEVFKHLIKS